MTARSPRKAAPAPKEEAAPPVPAATPIKLAHHAAAHHARNSLRLTSALHSKLTRRWRPALEALFRTDLVCTASPLKVEPAERWQSDSPGLASVHSYTFAPTGSVIVALPLALVIAATERFYGGRASSAPDVARSELSATEDWMAARIADSLCADLAALWPSAGDQACTPRQREHHRAAMSGGDTADSFAIAQLSIDGLTAEPLTIDLAYPLAQLREAEKTLRDTPHDAPAATPDHSRLNSAMGDIRLRARIVLARPQIALARLAALTEGDLLPIALPSTVPLLVDGRTVATGTLGAVNGMTAFRLASPQQEPTTA